MISRNYRALLMAPALGVLAGVFLTRLGLTLLLSLRYAPAPGQITPDRIA